MATSRSAARGGGGGEVAPPAAVQLLVDGPSDAPTLILAHGAGAPMDSPFMERIAHGLAAAGVRVARFELPYMRERRLSGARKPPDREPRLREAWLEAVGAVLALPVQPATKGPVAAR